MADLVSKVKDLESQVRRLAAIVIRQSLGGPFTANVITVSADYIVTLADFHIEVDASGAARTITLPPAATSTYFIFAITKIDATANVVTVDGDGGDLINGAVTLPIAAQWTTAILHCNGTSWTRI